MVRGEIDEKQLTSRPDHLWPELWKSMGKNAKLKEKQKCSNAKVYLENARKLRTIYIIDPEDTEFKETIKNARKKLETSVALAMPCKIMKRIVGVVHPTKFRRNLRVFWKLMNPQECVWEILNLQFTNIILQENSKESVTTAGCGVIRQDSVRNTGKAKVMFRRPHSIQKSKKHARTTGVV